MLTDLCDTPKVLQRNTLPLCNMCAHCKESGQFGVLEGERIGRNKRRRAQQFERKRRDTNQCVYGGVQACSHIKEWFAALHPLDIRSLYGEDENTVNTSTFTEREKCVRNTEILC